jgi:hypothetical protein
LTASHKAANAQRPEGFFVGFDYRSAPNKDNVSMAIETSFPQGKKSPVSIAIRNIFHHHPIPIDLCIKPIGRVIRILSKKNRQLRPK